MRPTSGVINIPWWGLQIRLPGPLHNSPQHLHAGPGPWSWNSPLSNNGRAARLVNYFLLHPPSPRHTSPEGRALYPPPSSHPAPQLILVSKSPLGKKGVRLLNLILLQFRAISSCWLPSAKLGTQLAVLLPKPFTTCTHCAFLATQSFYSRADPKLCFPDN